MPTSIALRLACHDPAVHRKQMPGNMQARGVFDAVEQARVEAIGARRMSGVAKNLTAMLDDHFHRGKFDEITDRADAPLADALAMMVRERLTGHATAAGGEEAGRSVAAVHRGQGARAARSSRRRDREPAQVRRRLHDLLDALELGDESDADQDDDDQDENQDGEQDQSGAEGQHDGEAQQDMNMEQADASSEDAAESAEAAQSSSSDTFED